MEPARPFLTVRHGPVPPRPRVQPAVATLVALGCALVASPAAAALDCGPARSLIDGQRPQRAIAYVDAINAPSTTTRPSSAPTSGPRRSGSSTLPRWGHQGRVPAQRQSATFAGMVVAFHDGRLAS